MLQRIRGYFTSQKLLEIDTAALSVSAPSDVHIESLAVHSTLTNADLYLHTSPEFCMKRLLAAGYPDIYSICRVFRDGELGPRHQPEFTMLEWYRLDFDLNEIVTDTINAIGAALNQPDLSDTATIVNYSDAFLETTGLDPWSASIADFANAASADSDLRKALGDQRDDWLDLLLTSNVAPTFSQDSLTVLQHYPASQAALARLCPGDARCADRFEVFIGKTELANGYVELTDAKIQSERIAADQASREKRGSPIRPGDDLLIDALNSGLPACSGVAVGVERLHMICEQTDDIRNVIPFAFEDQHD